MVITYGGFAVGAGTRYTLTDIHVTDRSYTRFTISFSVVIQAANSAETVAAIQVLSSALEEAYRKPFQDLLVEIGGAVWWDFRHSTNSALNPEPSIELDTGHRSKRSRKYNCVISLELPADLTGKDHRRSTSFQVLTDAVGRDVVGLEVLYTAVPGGLDALAHARASFLAFRDSLLTTLFPASTLADWDRSAQENYFPDEELKTCRATVTTVRFVWPRAGAANLDPAIFTGLTFQLGVFRRAHEGFEPLSSEEPFVASVTFQVGVKLPNQNLDELLEGTIIPYFASLLQSEVSAVLEPKSFGRQVSLGLSENTISGTLQYNVYASTTIRATLTTTESNYEGLTLVPVLDKQPFSRDLHRSPGQRRRVISFEILELAGAGGVRVGPGSGEAPFRDAVRQAEGEGFLVLDKPTDARERLFTFQDSASTSVAVRQREYVYVLEFAKVQGGGAGGGTNEPSSIGTTRERGSSGARAARRPTTGT